MDKEIICIYHGNCADGFGAAWAVWKALGDKAIYHAGVYQAPPPDVACKQVVLVDFSYKRAVMEQIILQAKSVLILDHHKTAIQDLEGLEGMNSNFSLEKSGAMLAWEHFHPAQEPPQLIKHIQDRDLWKFELEGTREIQAAVFSYPYDFEAWDKLMSMDLAQLRQEGTAIERKHFKDIDELLQLTTRRMNIAGHNIPVANLPYIFSSDAGHKLAEKEPFAACYMDNPDGRVFSLRSRPDGVDVSEVAKQYGGGGHKNAAGFKVSFEKAAEFETTPLKPEAASRDL